MARLVNMSASTKLSRNEVLRKEPQQLTIPTSPKEDAHSLAQNAIQQELETSSPSMSRIADVVNSWTNTPGPFWYDLSSGSKMSYALKCQEANGVKVERFNNVWMTASSASSLRDKFERLGLALPIEVDPIHKEMLQLATIQPLPSRPNEYFELNPFDLFELPYEARSIILGHVAGANTIIRPLLPGNTYNPRTAIALPAGPVQAGDRALRQETLLEVLKSSTIEIHSGLGNHRFQGWLGSLRFDKLKGQSSIVSGYNAVHRLSFPYFSRFPHRTLPPGTVNSDIEFMRRCVNRLRHVELTFVTAELIQIDPATGAWVDKGVAQLDAEYRLTRMLDLRNLQTLILKGPAAGPVGFPNGHGALLGLQAWFTAQYLNQLRWINVVVQ